MWAIFLKNLSEKLFSAKFIVNFRPNFKMSAFFVPGIYHYITEISIFSTIIPHRISPNSVLIGLTTIFKNRKICWG